jgi:hypothetical protein
MWLVQIATQKYAFILDHHVKKQSLRANFVEIKEI